MIPSREADEKSKMLFNSRLQNHTFLLSTINHTFVLTDLSGRARSAPNLFFAAHQTISVSVRARLPIPSHPEH